MTLEVVPAFLLRAQEEPWPLDRVLERLGTPDDPDGLVGGNDHFEFYWFPTRRALTKRNNRLAPDEEAVELERLRTTGPGRSRGRAPGSTRSSCRTGRSSS